MGLKSFTICVLALFQSAPSFAVNCTIYTEGCVDNRKQEMDDNFKDINDIYTKAKSCSEYKTRISSISSVVSASTTLYNAAVEYGSHTATKKEEGKKYETTRDLLATKRESIKSVIEIVIHTLGTETDDLRKINYNFTSNGDMPCNTTTTVITTSKTLGGSSNIGSKTGTFESSKGSTGVSSKLGNIETKACTDSAMKKEYTFCSKKYTCKEWELAD